MRLKPLGARALVKMVEGEEQTASGIVLPDTAREKPQTAEVVAVGDSEEVKVSAGDTVVLAKYSGTEVKVEGEDHLRAMLRQIEGSPKVLPQEGFVDELLFGHDWWDEEIESLRTMADQHRGLRIARSTGMLTPVGVGVPKPITKATTPKPATAPRPPEKHVTGRTAVAPPTSFSWPSTETHETKGAGEELDLRARSRLNELGYNTNQPRPARWRVLTASAVPELGLPKVANMIAWLCRTRKQQRGGRQKYARAIGEWEHDLARLHKELYPRDHSRFAWPRDEP